MPPSSISRRSSPISAGTVVGMALVVLVHLAFLVDYAFRYVCKGLIVWRPPSWFVWFPVLSLAIILTTALLLVLYIRGWRLPGWFGWGFLAIGFLWAFFALAAAINPSPTLWVFITEHAWLQGTQKVSVLNPVVGYTFYFLAFVTWCVLSLSPGRRWGWRLLGLGVVWSMWAVGSILVSGIEPPQFLG